PVERQFGNADLANGIRHRHALAAQNLNLPKLRDDLVGLVSLVCHCGPPSWSKPYFKVDPFNGGGSSREPAVAVAPIPGSKPDDISRQRILIGSAMRLLALGRAVLAENLAGKALRHGELRHDMIDATATASGAQKFCIRCPSGPEAASFRISFSSVRSET